MVFRKYKSMKYLLMVVVTGTGFSCSFFDPASPVASYIHIDSISVLTNNSSQGSNSKKVSDAWVLYDNVYLGTFPLPADIPLIGDGNHSIIVKAGIIENGIASSRSAYPKYSSFDTTLLLSTTNTISLLPRVTYGDAVTFPQIEDFDDASLSLVTTTTGNTPLTITAQSDSNAFEGNSGNAMLDETHNIFEVASSSAFTLPLSTLSYVELNYKGDQEFNIGVFITTTSGIIKTTLLTLRESTSWKKVYVNLNDLGGVSADGINYKIFLHAQKPLLLAVSNLYFDNFKVVY